MYPNSQEGAPKSSLCCTCFKDQSAKPTLDEIMTLNCTQYANTIQIFYFAKYIDLNVLKEREKKDVKLFKKMENFMICLASSPSLPYHNM